MNVVELIKKKEGSVVDVRTVEEFQMGHVEESVNLPMHEVPQRLDELKSMKKPLILICASGNRSGQVTQYLTGIGMEDVYNGGGWMEFMEILES
ncbi:MAG: rhodanese-like domain-containing protein [Vicingaceae bacterium]